MPNGCLKLKLKTWNFKLGDIMEDDSYDMDLGGGSPNSQQQQKLMYKYSPCLTRIEVGGFCFLAVRSRPKRTEFLL